MKCPKCQSEITYLRLYEEAEVLYHLTTDGDGLPDYDQRDIIISGEGNQSIECPECQEELFNDEMEAIRFLNGGMTK